MSAPEHQKLQNLYLLEHDKGWLSANISSGEDLSFLAVTAALKVQSLLIHICVCRTCYSLDDLGRSIKYLTYSTY